MKMSNLQRQKTSASAMRVFKVSMIMILLIVVFFFTYSCMGAQDQMLSDAENINFLQYTLPDDDDTVVVFETTLGTMKAVLYEDKAPNYCKYFKDLVNDGYYDNTYYFYVENEQKAYSFAGGKAVDGADTDDTDKTMLEPEKSVDLWPFRGALCTYGREKGIINKRNTTGSRVIFVNSIIFDDDMITQINELDANQQLVDYFINKGGVPNFSQEFTIFGQVYDGLDVLEEINSVEVDDKNIPVNEIKITKAYLSTYGENKAENESEVFPESFKNEDDDRVAESSYSGE